MIGFLKFYNFVLHKKNPCISSVDMFSGTLKFQWQELVNFSCVWWQIQLLLINPQKATFYYYK